MRPLHLALEGALSHKEKGPLLPPRRSVDSDGKRSLTVLSGFCLVWEERFHRGANGHTRHITCKQCEKSVIVARRREPAQLRGYLVQIALGTKWGSASRSQELAASVARLSLQDDKAKTTYNHCWLPGIAIVIARRMGCDSWKQ